MREEDSRRNKRGLGQRVPPGEEEGLVVRGMRCGLVGALVLLTAAQEKATAQWGTLRRPHS